MYGALANRFFRYFDIDIAEGITMTGQTVIRFIAGKLNEKLNELLETHGVDYVIGSDTDSVMVDLSVFVDAYTAAVGEVTTGEMVDIVDAFVKINLEDGVLTPQFKALSNTLGSANSTISMKREAIADRGLFRAKKHYVLQVWDNEGVRYAKPELKMVGIETARTTTPKICRERIEQALSIILNSSESELRKSFRTWRHEFFAAAPDEIAFPRGVNDIAKWDGGEAAQTNSLFEGDDNQVVSTAIKGTPVQVKAAICFNNLLKLHGLHEIEPLRSGSKLKFLYLRKGNPTGSNVIGITEELPKEFGLDGWIDRELQFEKALVTPLKSFTSLVGWDLSGRAVLANELFTEDVEYTKAVEAKEVERKTSLAREAKPVERKARSKPKTSTIDFF